MLDPVTLQLEVKFLSLVLLFHQGPDDLYRIVLWRIRQIEYHSDILLFSVLLYYLAMMDCAVVGEDCQLTPLI